MSQIGIIKFFFLVWRIINRQKASLSLSLSLSLFDIFFIESPPCEYGFHREGGWPHASLIPVVIFPLAPRESGWFFVSLDLFQWE